MRIRLSQLIDLFDRIQSFLTQMYFFELKVEQKEKVDNPLKVLDFLKDFNNPEFKKDVDFVLFEGKVRDATALVDKEPGFKPKFNFAKKFETKISLRF
jgi:hypothetical protein